MNSPLHIVHLDDNDDVRLVRDALVDDGLNVELTVVKTRQDFLAVLNGDGFDLILADYALPAFDGLEALSLCRARCPDRPFIFVTGAPGEERVIECFQSGAADCVLKTRLNRLGPAVRRASWKSKSKPTGGGRRKRSGKPKRPPRKPTKRRASSWPT